MEKRKLKNKEEKQIAPPSSPSSLQISTVSTILSHQPAHHNQTHPRKSTPRNLSSLHPPSKPPPVKLQTSLKNQPTPTVDWHCDAPRQNRTIFATSPGSKVHHFKHSTIERKLLAVHRSATYKQQQTCKQTNITAAHLQQLQRNYRYNRTELTTQIRKPIPFCRKRGLQQHGKMDKILHYKPTLQTPSYGYNNYCYSAVGNE